MTNEDKIAALEREIAALKAATPAPIIDTSQAAAQWRDEMHALAERRANNFRFSPQVQREMSRACGDADLADLVKASHRPLGPSAEAIPSSQRLIGAHLGGGAAVGNGWVEPAPLRPPPGTAMADRIVDEFDRRDRAELAERLAKQKLAEPK